MLQCKSLSSRFVKNGATIKNFGFAALKLRLPGQFKPTVPADKRRS
jgi:hypothetical protein